MLLLVVALAACAPSKTPSPSTSPDSPSAPSEKPKIALVMKSLANEFFSTMAEGARQHQAEHAAEYELIVNGIKDERDLKRQAELIDEMVAAGAKAIVVAPADSKALIPALRRAQKSGVVIVNIDNKLDSQVLQQEQLSIPFIGPNNQAGAAKVADYLASKLKTGDEVAILEGIRTSFNAQQRKQGFEESMTKAGMKIVDSQTANWEMNQATQLRPRC